ncbi:uncharacterized protein Dvar_76370 [Desulfosarcina variabilis str. Montpellier]|uniref:hypothetical protein n=1 Tax=Desulfosarcina variabilis TaxID=2300 RepID=UPI003AFAD00C
MQPNKSSIFVGLILTYLILSGCAKPVQLASLEADNAAKKFCSAKEFGVLYIYRPHHFGDTILNTVLYLDDQGVGRLKPDTFIKLPLEEGTHYVRTLLEEANGDIYEKSVKTNHRLEVKKEEIYYLEIENRAYWTQHGFLIHQKSDKVAQKEILKLKLVEQEEFGYIAPKLLAD